MRYLIASDIHGALPAAEALTTRFHEEGADRLLLLGDLLYHGPRNPLPEDAFAIIVAIDELKNRMPSGFSSELEWLAIKHVLFYGAERALKTFGYDPRVKHRLFGYMQTFFPHWRKNPYLQAETHNMRVAFRLLIRGNWRLYYMLSRCKALLRCA